MADTNMTNQYYELLENLLMVITAMDDLDLDLMNGALEKLCRLFRISKGVASFFSTLRHEKIQKGEEFVCYDDGSTNLIPAASIRIVSPAMTVVRSVAYIRDDVEPLSDIEQQRVELILRIVLNFLGRRRLQMVVEKLTFYDDAGYKNIRFYFRFLNRFAQERGLAGCVAAHFNLKHFTLVNQEVGRSAGNLVMKNFSKELERIIGEEGVVCRLGGDNFIMFFLRDRLEPVMNVLRGIPVVYDVNNGKRIMVTASAGIFLIPENDMEVTIDDIMERIVSTSQAARRSDVSDIIFYNEAMAAGREKTMRIQRLFPEALKKEEFQVYYQPKINVETGELSGAEALCRWLHDGELIPPMDFIPLLEQGTEICTLDFYMLDHVCRDIRRWLDEGRHVVRVSVNLSRKHMIDVDLLENIISIVDKNRVPHEYIEVELTETTTDVEFRDLKRVVSGLQEAGIYTSVDDFGMGYSSLNLIRAIPWNVLKVDKSFLPIEQDDKKSTRSIMFKYVVAMARELGLECIAEGVETRSQVEVLRENECELAQGFYFDRPLPLKEFEERLEVCRYDVD